MTEVLKENIKIIPIDLFTIPKEIDLMDFRYKTIECGDNIYSLRFPIIQPNEVVTIVNQIRKNRNNYLANLTITQIVDIIDKAVQLWTHPDYPKRKLAFKLLPIITGYNSETIKLEIKRFIRIFRKKELRRFIDTELNQPEILDDFHPQKNGGLTKAFGPTSVFQVFSGNIPGLQIWPIIMATLIKSASFGKTSMAEPLFPVLFAKTIAEVDPNLANCFAILPWKGGTKSLEETAANITDATIVYGSDKTVDSIRPLVPMFKPFLHYGYKISFSMIGKEALTAQYYSKTIKQAVEDVAVYDQQSCLSSQTIFIEKGGAISPQSAAKLIAAELANYQLKRPRALLTPEQAAAITRLRSQYQLKAINDPTIQVLSSEGNTDWTVIYHSTPGFINSPLNRSIHIFQIGHLEDVTTYLTPFKEYLQSCGLAAKPTRIFNLADQLGKVNVDRICALGEMTRTKPGWHHDGHFNLLDLIHFVDVEQSTEMLAEKFDPDVE